MDALSLGKTWRSANSPRSHWIAGLDGERRSHEWRAQQAQPGLLQDQCEETGRNTKQMKTNEFISRLRAAPNTQLVFTDHDGHTVKSGYHLTELKAASFETVDCGGQTNRWQETIVQLWVPSHAANEYMTAAKFLKIFEKVRGMIPLNLDTEVRIEYGDENFFSSTYRVRSVAHDQTTTHVLIEPPQTTCKARDRRHAALPTTGSCCAARAEACCVA
jgi:Family of unknown function (DUF6428)